MYNYLNLASEGFPILLNFLLNIECVHMLVFFDKVYVLQMYEKGAISELTY